MYKTLLILGINKAIDIDIKSKGLIIVFILLFYAYLSKKFMPYKTSRLNALD